MTLGPTSLQPLSPTRVESPCFPAVATASPIKLEKLIQHVNFLYKVMSSDSSLDGVQSSINFTKNLLQEHFDKVISSGCSVQSIKDHHSYQSAIDFLIQDTQGELQEYRPCIDCDDFKIIQLLGHPLEKGFGYLKYHSSSYSRFTGAHSLVLLETTEFDTQFK